MSFMFLAVFFSPLYVILNHLSANPSSKASGENICLYLSGNTIAFSLLSSYSYLSRGTTLIWCTEGYVLSTRQSKVSRRCGCASRPASCCRPAHRRCRRSRPCPRRAAWRQAQLNCWQARMRPAVRRVRAPNQSQTAPQKRTQRVLQVIKNIFTIKKC